jgi:polysaccharide deacetylase 2 family uncharacterized protein YibQ
VVADDPLGGEPFAVASTTAPAALSKAGEADAKATAKASSGPATHEAAAPPAAPAGTQTVTIINGMNGKREQVAIGAGSATGTKLATGGAKLAAVSIDAGLIDPSPQGGIPKIGAHDVRASEIYASPRSKAAAAVTGPRIALVVKRLGISASGTTEALAKLPAAVTLGFTPYGNDLDRWVARARGEGHEVLLQVPMEPFGYPDNDPGPQTLLTSLSPMQNAERLHWAMSRFQGYVGLTNYMGDRFVTNASAVKPVMTEAASRGLIYFDDGASARSVTAQASGASGSYLKADVAITAATTPGAVDAALARLETIARERGTAVGSAVASPLTIGRINAWAKTLAARGVTLVPLTALAGKPKSS